MPYEKESISCKHNPVYAFCVWHYIFKIKGVLVLVTLDHYGSLPQFMSLRTNISEGDKNKDKDFLGKHVKNISSCSVSGLCTPQWPQIIQWSS